MAASSPAQPTIPVIARAPFKVYYEGPALSLSAKNKVGPFDILPSHADFFSMLVPCDVVIETPERVVKFTARNGLITVQQGEIMLFVNM